MFQGPQWPEERGEKSAMSSHSWAVSKNWKLKIPPRGYIVKCSQFPHRRPWFTWFRPIYVSHANENHVHNSSLFFSSASFFPKKNKGRIERNFRKYFRHSAILSAVGWDFADLLLHVSLDVKIPGSLSIFFLRSFFMPRPKNCRWKAFRELLILGNWGGLSADFYPSRNCQTALKQIGKIIGRYEYFTYVPQKQKFINLIMYNYVLINIISLR